MQQGEKEGDDDQCVEQRGQHSALGTHERTRMLEQAYTHAMDRSTCAKGRHRRRQTLSARSFIILADALIEHPETLTDIIIHPRPLTADSDHQKSRHKLSKKAKKSYISLYGVCAGRCGARRLVSCSILSCFCVISAVSFLSRRWAWPLFVIPVPPAPAHIISGSTRVLRGTCRSVAVRS